MLGLRLKEDLAPAAANLTSSSRHAIGLTGSGRLHRNIQASHQRHSAGDSAAKTVLNEFYRVAFRKTIYDAIEPLQADLDAWMDSYNTQRTHQGRWCFGKTPMLTFLDSLPMAREKQTLEHAA